MSCQKCMPCVRSLAANLLGFGQIPGWIDAERFYAHTLPIIVAFPNSCEPSGSKWGVVLF